MTGIVISEVTEVGARDYPELRAGDLVVRIDGRNVNEFPDGVGIDSELGKIFLNRVVGDVVKLDLIEADSRKPYSVKLSSYAPRPMDRSVFGSR